MEPTNQKEASQEVATVIRISERKIQAHLEEAITYCE
jgi:hypothetical protein